jgi:hypothetical protein
MECLAERARVIANEDYPKLVELLGDGTSPLPASFDLVFKEHLDGTEAGIVVRRKRLLGREDYVIYLSADWLGSDPTNSDVYMNVTNLDVFLVHEMAHVAQDYRKVVPFHWREGIANYACSKLGYTKAWNCPRCSGKYPHYTSGYSCAAALLLFLESNYGSNSVRQLNAELRRGSYSDAFFPKVIGKTLAELWAEFQKTPSYTPLAADLNGASEALGLGAGRLPEDFPARVENYLRKQPAGTLTLEARGFLGKLCWEQGRLPGWSKREQGGMTVSMPANPNIETFPVTRTFHGQKDGDCSVYHYTLARTSKQDLSTLIHKSAHVFLVKPLRPTPSFLGWLIWLGVGRGRCE